MSTEATLPALHPKRKWTDYFTFCTDHKVIGIQYLVTSFLFFFIGGSFAEVMRTELATPDPDIVSPELYNQLMTLHGTIMIFLWNWTYPILQILVQTSATSRISVAGSGVRGC